MLGDQEKDYFVRNKILISTDLQKAIFSKKVLIAGCGIGSSLAESLLRMGFLTMTLADADTVSIHNLNRQNFRHEDIDQPKTTSLKKRLMGIFPFAKINTINEFLNEKNIPDIVAQHDIIIDTIDFLDIKAILDLHKYAQIYSKPVFSAMNIGAGAGLLYFPAHHPFKLEDFLKERLKEDPRTLPYALSLKECLKPIMSHLDDNTLHMVTHMIQLMEEHKPCPASQIAVGTASVAALVGTAVLNVLEGKKLEPAPRFHYLNLNSFLENTFRAVSLEG